MSELPIGKKPEVMRKYPHMMPQDSRIWTKYLLSNHLRSNEVWYDLHVGNAVVLPEGSSAAMQRVSEGVTRKRIDVVARIGAGFWVIEIKPIGTMAALGQAVTYRNIFAAEYAGAAESVAVVLCALIEEDIIETADDLGVLVLSLEGVLK